LEGAPENQWRRDAIWALIVIIAAASFLLGAIDRLALGQSGSLATPEETSGLAATFAIFTSIAGLFALAGYVTAFATGYNMFAEVEKPTVPWTLWDVSKAAAVAYLGAGLATHAVNLVAKQFTGSEMRDQATVAGTTILHAAIVVLPMIFVRASGGSFRQMGFTLQHWGQNLLHGVLGYLAVLPAFYLAILVSYTLVSSLGIPQQQNPILDSLAEPSSLWFRVLVVGITAVAGPFAEEVFFRGFLYPAMRRRLTVAKAVVLNGILFAAIHVSAVDFLPIMVLGMGMAFLFEKTRSLVGCTTFHVVNNSLRMLIYFLAVR